MLPAEVYRPRSYPPPGTAWPQWGDRQLDQAFSSLTEQAHSNLAAKHAAMRDIHKERLEKQGLVSYSRPPPTPIPTASSNGTQTEVNVSSQDMQTETEAMEAPVTQYFNMATEVDQGTQTDNFMSEKSLASKIRVKQNTKTKLPVRRDVKKTTPQAVSTQTAGVQTDNPEAMDDDQFTVNYGDEDERATVNYGSDIEVDDTEMTRRVDKRPTDVDREDKKKLKITPDVKTEDPPPQIKTEATQIKREGSKPVKKDNKILKKKDDDEPQMTGVNINRSTDMDFWEQQSARELRTQLNLREPGKVGDWAFKTRLQLINIVKDKINKGTW